MQCNRPTGNSACYHTARQQAELAMAMGTYDNLQLRVAKKPGAMPINQCPGLECLGLHDQFAPVYRSAEAPCLRALFM